MTLRPHLYVFLAAALAAPAPGAQPSLETPAISVTQGFRKHVTYEELNRACAAPQEVRACLEFQRERFDCRCEPAGEQWKVRAAIDLDVVVHFVRPRSISHEASHIVDIKSALPRSLEPYLAKRFEGASACAAFATAISNPAFTRGLMNRLRAESNRKLR